MLGFKVRMTRGKTWGQAESEDFITPEFLEKIGKLLVASVVYEARKDLAKQGNGPTPTGIAEGIPASEKFFKSFYFKIEHETVVLYSSWPQIEQIVDGRQPFSMDWLTRQAGVSRVPMKGPQGTVLAKTTPASPQEAWMHPGFRKHNFIRRGYERARRQMDKMLAEQVVKALSGMNPT